MEFHGVDMTGQIHVEELSTLASWTSSDKRRIVYVTDEDCYYIGGNTEWIKLPSPAEDVSFDDTNVNFTATDVQEALEQLGGIYTYAFYFGDESDGAFDSNSPGAGYTDAGTYDWEIDGSGSDDDVFEVMNFTTFTLRTGHSLTTANRKKCLLIYCTGDCTINGHLNMDSKGAKGQPDDDIKTYRFIQNVEPFSNEQFQYVFNIPEVGANGNDSAITGDTGVSGQTGGGGGGGPADYALGGSGQTGTAWCGGSGGGGGSCYGGTGGTANSYGGKGGNGGIAVYATGWVDGGGGGGGAGNPGGNAGTSYGTGQSGQAGGLGGGGTILLIVKGNLTIGAAGVISADGGNGGSAGNGVVGAACGAGGAGGGAGGGSIVIAYVGTLSNSGTIQANGGAGGGYGGAGSIQGPTKISSVI